MPDVIAHTHTILLVKWPRPYKYPECMLIIITMVTKGFVIIISGEMASTDKYVLNADYTGSNMGTLYKTSGEMA